MQLLFRISVDRFPSCIIMIIGYGVFSNKRLPLEKTLNSKKTLYSNKTLYAKKTLSSNITVEKIGREVLYIRI